MGALVLLVVFANVTRGAYALGTVRYTIRDVGRAIGALARSLPEDRRRTAGDTADTFALEDRLFAFVVRNWPEANMYMNLDGVSRFRPGFVLVTWRRGKIMGDREGASIAGMVVAHTFDYWPDDEGHPRLRTQLYTPRELSSRLPVR
jgi:hypothetical protein